MTSVTCRRRDRPGRTGSSRWPGSSPCWRWWDGRRYASTDDAFVGGDMIPVLSRVSGYVQAVNVQENEVVKPGQPLVEVDPSELRHHLAQAQADLEAARAAAGGGGLAGAQVEVARAQ